MKSRALWLGVFLSFAGRLWPGFCLDHRHGDRSRAVRPSPTPRSRSAVPNTASTAPATTNESGDYLFAAVARRIYDLIVVAHGFKKYEAKGVKLQVGQKARADVALQVGATNTEVTVEGSSVAQVETQSSELSGTVTGKEITQLQLNGRNFTQLVDTGARRQQSDRAG